ncbi:hypothetical protein [Paucisalibacillus globulus]|uniref:hypothetical protein n=1 Tax=Paucisalibacillus globulus TaxID=351095 RepID=UPI0003F89ADE|nr:hypothetical protein [Paucisalibacillus globulus]
MEDHFSRPKSIGALLDQTFRMSKNNFSTFFMIMLIVIGPIVVMNAFISFLTGSSFFRDVAGGSSFLEQLSNTIDESTYGTTTLAQDLGTLLVGLVTIVLYPIAYVAVIYTIEAIKNQEEYTVGSVIKKAFSRFWPIFGSSLLVSVIVFGMVFVPVLVISMVTAVGALIHPIIGIGMFLVLFLAVGAVVAYFLTRWGLFLPAVAFEPCAPGLGRSWNLTRKNFWRTFGIFVVIGAITFVISGIFDFLFTALLGNSVLYSILINMISIVTTILLSVGYALIYFDLKLRNDGDDLMVMIENYESPNE